MRLISILLSFFAALVISGCGHSGSLSITSPTEEKILISLDTKDDFSLDQKEGRVLVYQKQKVMLTGELLDEDGAKGKLATLSAFSGSAAIHKKEEKFISYEIYGQNGRLSYYLFPVGKSSYFFGYTYLPFDMADSVVDRLTFKGET